MNAKQRAAEKAVEFIVDGMTVGIGTGSTTYFAIEAIGKRVQQGLKIQAVASSVRSEELAKNFGITLIPFSGVETIDLYIDGADEVDEALNLIKGGGGALLREKIIAFNSKSFLVIVDDSKIVEHLGRFPLPVEVVPFAHELTLKQLARLGGRPTIRYQNIEPYFTDNGNLVVDCAFEKIEKVKELHLALNALPGVVENGLFPCDMVSRVIVGNHSGGVQIITNRISRKNMQ